MCLQTSTIPKPISASGFLELHSEDQEIRTQGLKLLRSFKTGFVKQLMKHVSQEDLNKLEAEAAENMAQELHCAQLEDIQSALTMDMSDPNHQEALAELLKISGELPDDVAVKVKEIQNEVLGVHLEELEDAAERKRPLPPCPLILPKSMAEEAEKCQDKLTSQQKFAEEMKALRDGSTVSFYNAAILLPALTDVERQQLQSYMDENEGKLVKIECNLLKALCATCKEIRGLFDTMSVLVAEGVRKSNAATLKASPTLKKLANLPKDDLKTVHGWHAGKCLLEGSSTNTPTAANFWQTISFFQKNTALWTTIFPVGETMHFKPAFFVFVKEAMKLFVGDEAAAASPEDDCAWCQDTDVSLRNCHRGDVMEFTAAAFRKLVKDS